MRPRGGAGSVAGAHSTLIGLMFQRRRRQRRLTIAALAKMKGIPARAIKNYERDRLYGISNKPLAALHKLNKRWTLEDYENGTHNTLPTWPDHKRSCSFNDPAVRHRATLNSLESRRMKAM